MRGRREVTLQCIVSEKEGDHVVAGGGGVLCLSGGRLLENQARARGFWRKSKLAGQKMRQVLGGDHMCYPCLSLGALHAPVKQPVWSEHSMGWNTPYTAHTHREHNQPHTANTKTQDVQETDTTRPAMRNPGSCAVGAAVLIVARQSVGLLPTASDFVQTCRNYPLVPL